GHPDVEVSVGNHEAVGHGLRLARNWYPLEILHFPVRSPAQMARKYTQAWTAEKSYETSIGRSHHIDGAYRNLLAMGTDALYDSYVVDDVALTAGLGDRTLVRDTRLRALVRSRRGVVDVPTLADDLDLFEELQVMASRDAAWAQRARLIEIARRITAI